MKGQKLTDLQLELLKVYALQPSEDDLLAIKKMLGNYFSEKLLNNVQNSIAKRNFTDDDFDGWLNE